MSAAGVEATSMRGTDRDYSGFATHELVAVYEEFADCDLTTLSERIGTDVRTLKDYLVYQNYSFVGLGIADKICLALGLNVNRLIEDGRLHIIPARNSRNAALRIVEDTLAIQDEGAPEIDIEAAVTELLELGAKLNVRNEAQIERLRRDSERSKERLALQRQENDL